MVDRARMSNIPLPEQALKCPRCDSTNTKFCYFNNYSLTQPRHFCKTCRRYWTRGGALRNVPVGGGCRRNKRSSSSKGGGGGSSRSKSPDVSSSDRPVGSATSSAIPSSSAGTSVDMIVPMRFINSHPFSTTTENHHQFGGPGESLGMSYGYGYGGGAGGGELGFSIGGSGSVFEQQWRFQQQIKPSFPFLTGGLEGSNGLFEGGGGRVDQFQGYYSHLRPRLLSSGGTSSVAALSSSVIKTEDPHHNQVLGNETGQQYWINAGGNGNGASINAWSDISGFSSTSAATNHPL